VKANLKSLQVGGVASLRYLDKDVPSAFIKETVPSARLEMTGLTTDAQADLKNHGGPDKALCVYALEHYPYWEKRLNRQLPVAAFGENLSTVGLLETNLHIGDIYKVGETVVQVAQPRQPCFKLGARHHLPNFALWLQETGHTGFYFRCLHVGTIHEGDDIVLLEPHPAGITVAEANRVMHHDKKDTDAIKKLLDVTALSASWRKTLEGRLEGIYKSDEARLGKRQ
jgi:MOSC domain-containing protein YiiM